LRRLSPSEIESGLVVGGVLHLVLCFDDGLNTMDDAWMTLLATQLQRATDDRSVRVALLSARGAAFCARANICGLPSSARIKALGDRCWRY
jgi:enoyl-CoA hydratase/carnithine racemase